MEQLDLQRLAYIKQEMSYAQAGDLAAEGRIYTHHLPWLMEEYQRLHGLAFSAEAEAQEEVAQIDATPAAVVLAEENGIDLAAVEGTGKEGRITHSDVLAVLSQEPEDEDPGDDQDSAEIHDGADE